MSGRDRTIGGMEIAALACLLTGAPIMGQPRRYAGRDLRPREHFIPDEPLTKRQKRRLRGKAGRK